MSRGKTTPEGWDVRRYRVALPSRVWEWVSRQASYIGCGETAFVGAMLLLQFQAHERDSRAEGGEGEADLPFLGEEGNVMPPGWEQEEFELDAMIG